MDCISITLWLLFLGIAFISSAFWGSYGCEVEKKKFWKKDWKGGWIEPLGIFLSEFLGSFAGWYCFYVLISRHQDKITFGNFDIFLGTIAVIGITGYSHKLVEAINKTKK